MLPDGWLKTDLGAVTEIVTSGSRNWAKYYSDSGSKFIRMTNLNRDGIHLKLDDMKFVDVKSDSSDGKRTSLQSGDILISITAELGKIGWIPENLGEAYINQHTALVRLNKDKVYSKYVAYLLASNRMNKVINRLNDSGAKSGLNLSTIGKIPVSIAPLPEQKKIAKILSTWDKAITTTEQLIANSQQQKKSLMQQLLTGNKRLAGFSGEWEKSFLGGHCSITTGKLDANAMVENGKYRFYTCAKNHYFIDEYVFNTEALLISGNGANVGYIHHYQGKFNAYQRTYVLDKFDEDIIFIKYYLEQFLHRRITTEKKDGNTPYIVMGTLSEMVIRLPKLEEQQKIAQVLSNADQEIETLQQKLNFLKEEKKALMQQLLTGKRRVQINLTGVKYV